MAAPLRFRRLAILIGPLAGALMLPGVAAAQETEPPAEESPAPAEDEQAQGPPAAGAAECAATGYLAGSEDEVSQLRGELSEQSVHRVDGVPLRSGQTWVIPDGSQPVVVLDSTRPVSGGEVWVSLAGQEFEAVTEDYAEAQERYIPNVTMPHLGATVRSLGLRVDSGECEVAVALSVDRDVWSTLVGAVALGVTGLFGLLTVLVARLRKGGWVRRFGFAAPFGLIAGLGQGSVLVEAGVVDPFSMFPWWAPAAGLVLAALLPFTRLRRRRAAPQAGGPAPGVPPQAPLAGFRLDALVARTEAAGIYRATRVRADAPPTVADQPAADQPAADQPAADQPAADQPAADQPAADQPAEGQPAEGQPAEGQPATGQPAEGQPVAAAGPAPEPPPPPAPAPAPAQERALVKVVLAERAGEPAARLRLEREAAALSGLEHPNLLKLREVVPAPAGPPTLVFEDVEGLTLRQFCERGGSLSGAQVLTVLVGVLSGLQAVHARELVHRDVRPDQVWLTADGRVLLGGFELACAGVEHPVAPEATEPYASPEQRAGQMLDARSDLYACGVMLRELLPAPMPTPVQNLLSSVLADDPGARPGSADQLAAGLRAAADQAYGPDWVGRGALAGAVASYLAVGAAAGGYALAGGAATTGAGAVAGAAGAAGAGALGAAAQSAGQGMSQGGGSLGAAGIPAGAPTTAGVTAAAAPAATSGGGGGALGAVANAAVAVAAGAAIVVGSVLVDPDPAEARSEVITPDQARVIFIRTMNEGRDREFAHFSEDGQAGFENLLDEQDAVEESPLTGVTVGVPRDQFEYPAWFVASALIPLEDGTVSLFTRFERAESGEDWSVTSFSWSLDRLLPPPLLDDDGWLAEPDPGDLLVAPEELPGRYADWFARAEQDREVGADELLELRFDNGVIDVMTEPEPFYSEGDPSQVSSEFAFSPGEVQDDPILLADGTAQVSFTISIDGIRYNRPGRRTGGCDVYYLFWIDNDPPGRFRRLEWVQQVTAVAWIPVAGLVEDPAPTASPDPSANPEPSPDEQDEQDEPVDQSEPELAPVDPETVEVVDTHLETTSRDGDRC